MNVTRLLRAAKPRGLSPPFRACAHAIGAGIYGVPELRMRFRGEAVTEYDRVELSMAVPLAGGNFNYAYVPWSQSIKRSCSGRSP